MAAGSVRAGSAFVEVGLKSRVAEGVRKVQRELSGLQSALTGAGTALLSGGLGIAGLLVVPLKFAANMEQTSVAFQSIVGDADKAAAALDDIKQLAASTPFKFGELAAAGQKLLAFKSDSAQVGEELRRIGDISAAIGAPVGEIAELYGKARVQGRLFGEDINQLTGRGIPIIGELAKQFGVTDSEVKKLVENGDVNFQHLEQAFISLTSSGGMFFGMMEAQSQTFWGKLSTLADNAINAMMPLGTELLAIIGPAMDQASSLVASIGDALANSGGLATGFAVAAGIAGAAGVTLLGIAGALWVTVEGLGIASAVTGFIISTLSTAWGVLSAAASIVGTIYGIVNLVVLAMSGNLGAQVAIAVWVAGAHAAAASVVSAVWNAAAVAVEIAQALMTGGLSTLLKAIVTGAIVVAALVAAFVVMKTEAGSAFGYIKSVVGNIVSVVSDVVTGIKDALSAGQYLLAAKILWAGLRALFFMGVQGTIDLFKALPGKIWQILKNFTSTFVSTLWSMFSSIPSILMRALKGESIGDILASFMGGGDFLSDQIRSAKNELASLKDAASTVAAITTAQNEADQAAKADAAMKKAMGAAGATANVAATDDPAAKAAEVAKAAKDRVDRLKEEINELKHGADAAELMKLQQEGLTREQIAAVKSLMQQKAALEAAREAETRRGEAIVENLQKQSEQFAKNGASPEAIFAKHMEVIDAALRDGKITKEQAGTARENATKDRGDRIQSRNDEGKQLAESLRTPLEKFNAEKERIDGLARTKAITPETASRAVARARETLDDETKKKPDSKKAADNAKNTVAEFGSQASLDTLRRTQTGKTAIEDKAPWAAPLVENARIQVAELRQFPARMAMVMREQQQQLINLQPLQELGVRQLVASSDLKRVAEKIAANTSPAPTESV